jgi:DNA-binding transcriptional LysR family regulator|tara:strand:+ start:118 stop:1017 length:900 start_codon:yes stop_codon:yes gene_type:complete
MDIESLKAFIAICESGSFSLAAEQLHITQPAVSKRIALLEERLQSRLFDRIGRRIQLTQAGKELLPRAQGILGQLEDTKRAIHNLSGSVNGRLVLATNHHIGIWRLPMILKQYTQQFKDVSMDLHFMDSAVAYEAVILGDVEIGIITLAPNPEHHVCSLPIWQDQLQFVCAKDHPLASKTSVLLQDLSQHPAILPDETTFTGNIAQQLFGDHSLDLQVVMSTNYHETIKTLVAVGLGWSVLPESMIDSAVHKLELPDINISRTLGVIRHAERTMSNAATEFINLLRSNADPNLTDQEWC